LARILVVEDNEMNLDVLRRRLERLGHKILVALDGQEGVERATLELPDLILMDISLPVMDGWEATRRLKANELTSKIPVLALTAHALLEDRERSMLVGCDDYDTKPIDFQRLVGKMNCLLGRKQAV
jgi:two-component system cell cycle response regulator DivK